MNHSTRIEQLDNAGKVAKNSVALFSVAVLTKGAGLIMIVLIARYLGPAALGSYAVVMGLGLLVEHVVPLGQTLLVVRVVARDRSQLLTYWLNTSLVTLVSAVVLGVALVGFVHLVGYDVEVVTSTYIVALYLPIAGLYAIAQAVVQSLEQMKYMTLSALVGWVLGLFTLWVLLLWEVGFVAAFLGYGIFQLVAWLVLTLVILREVGLSVGPWRNAIDLKLCWDNLRTSFSFTLQTLLMRALLQVSVIILSLLVTMQAVGMFDAANRIPQTSAMIVSVVALSILPSLSRTFVTKRSQAVALIETSLKVLMVVILPFVFIVSVLAGPLIAFVYGPGYEAAVSVLQVIIWAQVFFVADGVLNQIMIASNNERAMVRRTGAALVVNVILILLLAPRYGAVGAAWAVIVTHALNLGLDAQFVFSRITSLSLIASVGKPLLCASLAAGVALVLHPLGMWAVLTFFLSLYLVSLLVLRVFTPDELLLARLLSNRLWKRVTALR